MASTKKVHFTPEAVHEKGYVPGHATSSEIHGKVRDDALVDTSTRAQALTPSQKKSHPLWYHINSLYLFTRSDFKVIVYPQTAVGIFHALAGPLITNNDHPSLLATLGRIPLVLLWNWYTVLIFDIANQRLPDSVLEDQANKPWRPIPSGRLTPDQARKFLFFMIPTGLLVSRFIGGFNEGVAMLILTWMFNDLGGNSDHHLTRNLMNALGFICFGVGSTRVAVGTPSTTQLTDTANIWFAMIGCIVFSTVQVQDFPDVEGDAARGRKTIPLVYGEWPARLSVAASVLAWSVICPGFWAFSSLAGYLVLLVPGMLIAYRILVIRNVAADDKTYKIWCVWLVLVYLLPLLRNPDSVIESGRHLSSLLVKPN